MTYYKMVFGLAQHHKYQISEIENLMPYERDIYFNMLLDFIESQKDNKRGQ
jgi:hypothetical protein